MPAKSSIQDFLKIYLRERPLFLALIRAQEAELFQRHLPLKNPVLDFGCGDGYFAKVTFASKSKAHKKEQKHIIDVGLDIKESRIKEAQDLGVYKKVVTYDGISIPSADNYFSTIVSNCVLEHLPALEGALKEIYRVLRPGGLFLATVTTDKWEEYLLGGMILGDRYKRWMKEKQKHFNLLNLTQWQKSFNSAGFKIASKEGYLNKGQVRLVEVSHYLSLPSLLSYKFLGEWKPFKVPFPPPALFDRFICLNARPNDSSGLFFVLKK